MNNEKLDFKIIGKKNLETNSYERITIEKNRINYEVTVSKGEKQGIDINFTKNIKKISHLDKITQIVEYYLNNNVINKVEMIKNLRCGSSTSRVLLFRYYKDFIENDFIYKIYNLIMHKYNLDRQQFLDENNYISNYVINTKEGVSSYNIKDDAIDLKLISNNKKIDDYEKQFLLDFLTNIIQNANDVKLETYKWNEFKMSIPCLDLYVDNIKINFENNNEEIKQIVYNVLREYKEKSISK